MNSCAYHPQNFAAVQCNSCGRMLCPACDHRIRGFPFCADCIVAGIELLNVQQQSSGAKTSRQTSSFLAVILSLFCPGLGAAYNGQTAKALVHFAVFVSLFQMAILTNGMPLFVLGFLGAWMFAAIDAGRTARAIQRGLPAETTEDLWLKRLTAKPLTWAIAFIGLGTAFFLHTTLGVRLPVKEGLPILLVALGVYWLIGYFQRRRQVAEPEPSFGAFGSPVVNGNFQPNSYGGTLSASSQTSVTQRSQR
jgi:hypothetical protein